MDVHITPVSNPLRTTQNEVAKHIQTEIMPKCSQQNTYYPLSIYLFLKRMHDVHKNGSVNFKIYLYIYNNKEHI